jgi:hypothetical protein
MQAKMNTISEEKKVKAAKEHKCNYCGLKIEKGEMYLTATYKESGNVYVWKSHIECSELAYKLEWFGDNNEGLSAEHFQEGVRVEYERVCPKNVRDMEIASFGGKLKYVINHYKKYVKCKNRKSPPKSD